MKIFTLPDLGEGLQEAEICEWHVAEGDDVDIDQPLLSVETEKAVVEIPSPRAGRVARLFVAPGDILQVGDPLGDLLLACGQHGDLAVGRSGRVPRDLESSGESAALGHALRPTPLLEVDG